MMTNALLMNLYVTHFDDVTRHFCRLLTIYDLDVNCQALVPNPQSRGLGLTLKSYKNLIK